MPATYEPIASATLGSAAATVSFSSIASTWTDLVLVLTGTQTTNGNGIFMRFNSDSGTNFSSTRLWGNGSSVGSNRSSSTATAFIESNGIGDTNPATVVIQVMAYANTNVFKTALVGAADASLGVTRSVFLWRSTNAIDTVTIHSAGAGTFKSGTTAALYGIKAA